jgi:hypothetical protein
MPPPHICGARAKFPRTPRAATKGEFEAALRARLGEGTAVAKLGAAAVYERIVGHLAVAP